eukprot:m.174172 g.174172  ORF g.174172 m.174172 type:complete len:385 (+) comp24352_c0_seq3:1995-3149(+)
MTDAVTLKPGAVGGVPADIVVSIIWRSITKVNVVDQTFDAEINIKSTAHRGVEVLDPTFRGPELKVMNAAAIEVINTPAWQVKQNGDLVEEVQVRGKFTSHFDMENFPLDTQELSVIIQCDRAVLRPGPNVTTKQVVRLVVSDTNDPVPCTLVESGVTIAPTLYHTQSMLIQAGHSDASDSSRGNVYSQIHSSIIIERQPGFFWWNAIFPTFLFTNLTFLSMAIPAEEAADRLAVTVSLILTAGAYKIIAANAVPEIPHLTLLDQYVVGSLVISSLVAVQNTIGELTEDTDLDRLCGRVLMALWGFFNLCYTARWLFVQRFRRTLRDATMLPQRDPHYLSDDPAIHSVPRWERQFDSESSVNLRVTPKKANTFYAHTQSFGHHI